MQFGLLENLENRLLLHEGHDHFAVKINFQPETTLTVPPGYRADIGRPFGTRANKFVYGWSAGNESEARDRNNPASQDDRYDTFNHFGEKSWQIAVPDGVYEVRIVAGDPNFFNSIYKISVEEVIGVNGTPTSGNRWIDGTTMVRVSDGRLTIKNAAGAQNNKIAFIDIQQVDGPTAPPGAPTNLAAEAISATKITLDWDDNSNDETGFRIERKRGSIGGYMPIAILAPNTSSYVDTQLRPGTKYAYRIRAFNAAGVSFHTNQDPARTFALTGTTIQWTTLAPSPIVRAEALRAIVDGKLYVLGGFNGNNGPVVRSDVYDPATNQWTRIADLPRRLTHAGTAVDGRDIYVAGGYIGIGPGFTQQFGTDEAWKFNVDSQQWTALPDLPKSVASGGLVVLGRELHYFSGNDSNRDDIGDHFIVPLDSDNPAWVASAPLPNPRSHMGYVTFGGKIYALAGQTGNDAGLDTLPLVHLWDPASPNQWTRLADAPLSVSHISSSTFVMGNRIILAGGETADGDATAAVMAFDPLANSWTTLTSLPGARFSGVGAQIDGIIYFTTGSSQTTTYRGIFIA